MKKTLVTLPLLSSRGGAIRTLKSVVSTARVMAISSALAVCFIAMPREGYAQFWDDTPPNTIFSAPVSTTNVGIGTSTIPHGTRLIVAEGAFAHLLSGTVGNSSDIWSRINESDPLDINARNFSLVGQFVNSVTGTIYGLEVNRQGTSIQSGVLEENGIVRPIIYYNSTLPLIFVSKATNGNLQETMSLSSTGQLLITGAPVSGGFNSKVEVYGGNITQVSSGNSGGQTTSDIFTSIGGRLGTQPPPQAPGINAQGLRVQWGQNGANFGMTDFDDPSLPNVKNAFISWQDLTVNNLDDVNNRLLIGFRDNTSPAVGANFREVATFTNTSRLGVGISTPLAKIHAEGGNIGQSEVDYLSPGTKWNYLGRETSRSQYFGQFTNSTLTSVEMGIGVDNFTGDPEMPAINWYHVGDQKKDLIFNYHLQYGSSPSIEAMRLKSNGHVAIGSPSAASILSVAGSTSVGSSYVNTSAPTNGLIVEGRVGIGTSNPTATFAINTIDPGGNPIPVNAPISLHVAGGGILCNQYGVGSDARMKRNVKPIEAPLSLVKQLKGVNYEVNLTASTEKETWMPSSGFIAQEVKEVLPQVVMNLENGFLALNYDAIIPIVVEALKEQQAIIEKQQEEITLLKNGENGSKRVQSLEQLTTVSKNKLEQNIPNPFSGTTIIRYSWVEGNRAILMIFDLNGTTVHKVENLEKGDQELSLELSNLASGLYFYSLVVDGAESITKRMVLNK